MKKKWFIAAGIILVLVLAGWIAIPAVEAQLLSSLEKQDLENRIQEELKTTGLRITYQGKRYELLYGLILKGAKLEKEQNGEYVPVAEFRNLVLSVSYIRWLTGGEPLKSIRSYSGRIFASTILNHRSESFLERLRTFLSARDIDIAFTGIFWETGQRGADSRIRVDMNLAADDGALHLDFRFHGDSGEIKFEGMLDKSRRRVFITLSDVPLSLLLDFLRTSDSVPSLQILPEWSEFTGIINGKGSMDLQDPGTAANLKGNIRNLNLVSGDPFGLQLRDLNGDFHFSQVFSYADGVLKSDIQIESNPTLQSRLSYEKSRSGLPHRVQLKGRAEFTDSRQTQENSISTSFMHCSGAADYSIELAYNDSLSRIEVVPDVKLQDFRILPPVDWAGSRDALVNLELHLDGKNESLTGAGTVLGAKTAINSRGSLSLSRDTEGKLTLVQNFSHSAEIRGLSYEQLTALILDAHSWILNRASKPDAKKAEDQGPLWENQFIDMPLYSQILAGLNWKGEIRLLDLHGGKGLPGKATVRLSSNRQSFNISLDEDRGEPGVLRGRYMGVWNEQLPTHTLSLNIKQKDIEINWPRITAGQGPNGVSIDANFSSNGLYPADLINYSNGNMYFEAYNMDLKAFAPFELGLKMLGKKVPDGPVPGDIEVVRSGTGQEIEYYRIVVETDDLVARGGGRYTIYEGGRTWLNVATDGNQQKVNFQVQKTGKWLPDDGL
ncbi:MAG: hypothetical protein KDK23_12185 [Leptospiraceae bacterium]|nr:hypothetical protein [Leptospiraceae bacterium]